MILEGYLEFENSIPVVMESLEKQFPVNVAGVDGLMCTPGLSEKFKDKELGPLQAPAIGEVTFIKEFYWGSVYSYPDGDSGVKACKIVFPEVSEATFDLLSDKIVKALPQWRERLIANVSLKMRKDLRHEQRARTLSTMYDDSRSELFKRMNGVNKRIVPMDTETPSIQIHISDFQGFNEDELKKVLLATSEGMRPLLPFYFFLDAERANFDENLRKSILDSATAAEVCLSMLISRHLPEAEDLNRYIFSKHNSLAQKRELLKVLGVVLPFSENEYKESLDRIRNKVIHAGYIPTEREAKNALKITETTLYNLFSDRMYETIQ